MEIGDLVRYETQYGNLCLGKITRVNIGKNLSGKDLIEVYSFEGKQKFVVSVDSVRCKRKLDLECKAKIEVLEEIIKVFDKESNEDMALSVRVMRDIFIDFLLEKLEELKGEE